MSRSAVAVDVALALKAGTDRAAPGGEVTVALCGHWEHEGACRWPHNSAIDTSTKPARLRTIVVTAGEDRREVLDRIETGLRRDGRWRVLSLVVRPVAGDELVLAERLAHL